MPYGKPKTDIERLKTHFGRDWKKHDVSELPKRGTGRGWEDMIKLNISNRDIDKIKQISTPKRREQMPAKYFLLPSERKFPYRNPDGSLNCKLVKAAISRAGQYGYKEVEAKAKAIYYKYCSKR